MKVSIIMVSWNIREDLVNCLRSIEENRPCEQFEVIVVDNASSDGTVDTIKRNFPHVRVIANKENRGFSAANNQGIEIAKGQYVLLLNPDTIVHRNSLDNLTSVLDENPAAGACGPRLIDGDGAIYRSVGYIPTFRAILHGRTVLRSLGVFRGHYKKLTANDFDYNKSADVDQLSGAALMVRRSVMEQIGLMDESFFMYYEDVDLCLRIRKADWEIVYTPESVITHIAGRSAEQVSVKKRIMLYRSLFIYLRKHRGSLATWLFGLIFKPAVIVRDGLNIFSGIITWPVFVLSSDESRQLKAQAKIKNSAFFLGKYLWEFIFKI